MKILLLEQDIKSAKEIENIVLSDENYSLVKRASIPEGINALKMNKDITLIISEQDFSESSVFDLLKYTKSTIEYKNIPVLIVSSSIDQESIIRSIELGASDYIAKPFTEEVLLSKIKKYAKSVSETVLIVDDDELIQGLLKKTLERQGYKTYISGNGEEALEIIEKEDLISVVISDIEMPVMNGMDLLKNIKEKFPDLPVLMISGKRDKNSHYDIIQAGASGFITKPFKNTDIISNLKTAISRTSKKQTLRTAG